MLSFLRFNREKRDQKRRRSTTSWSPALESLEELILLSPTPRWILPPTRDITRPIVNLVIPQNRSTVYTNPTSSTLTLTANARDTQSGIASVQFFVDGRSIAKTTTAPYSISWNTKNISGRHTIKVVARDRAGNVRTSAPVVVKFVLDKTPPSVTLNPPPRSVSGVQPLTAIASDTKGGGIASVQFLLDGYKSLGIATTAPYTIWWNTTQESPGPHSLTAVARDVAGNVRTSAVMSTTVLDQTPPTITGAPGRAANAAGWYNSNVTVSFTGNDAFSGIASVTGPVTVSTDGTNQSVTGTATDKAGNSASTTVSGINLDKTAPTITGAAAQAANAAGWYNSNVTVSFTGNDALSGVASVTGPVTVSTEGANQSVTGTATDKAGNSASATVSGINLDKTAPTITGAADQAANTAGWYNSNVTVSFTGNDALSGVASVTGPVTVSAEGTNQSVTGTATDKAGNSASTTVSGINLDKTAPTITGAAAQAANAAGWYNSNVTVSFTGNHALSGVASVTGPVTVSAEDANRSVTGTATDKAGNSASATVSGINLDKTAPTITGTPA